MPTIIHPCNDHFLIIVIAIPVPSDVRVKTVLYETSAKELVAQLCFIHSECTWDQFLRLNITLERDFFLVLDWDSAIQENVASGRSSTSSTFVHEGPNRLTGISAMCRIFDDIDEIRGIRKMLEIGKWYEEQGDHIPASLAAHFEALQVMSRDWSAYTNLKRAVCEVFDLPHQYEAMPHRMLPLVSMSLGFLEIGMLLETIPSFVSDMLHNYRHLPMGERSRGFRGLALFLELWGSYVAPEHVIEFLNDMDVADQESSFLIDTVVRAAAQHDGWGKILLQKLFENFSRDPYQLYLLLSLTIVGNTRAQS